MLSWSRSKTPITEAEVWRRQKTPGDPRDDAGHGTGGGTEQGTVTSVNLHERVRNAILRGLSTPSNEPGEQLHAALHMLSKHRTLVLQERLSEQLGDRIARGPFRGLRYPPSASIGSGTAKLLGTYEEPLHAWISDTIGARYDEILYAAGDDGYYPVLLAARMPSTAVHAVFSSERARAAAADLAARNNVGERVHIAEATSRDTWEAPPDRGRRRLVFVDGNEPALGLLETAARSQQIDLLVEYATREAPACVQRLAQELNESHDVKLRRDTGYRQEEPAEDALAQCSQLERLLARWEWRRETVSWMRAVTRVNGRRRERGPD